MDFRADRETKIRRLLPNAAAAVDGWCALRGARARFGESGPPDFEWARNWCSVAVDLPGEDDSPRELDGFVVCAVHLADRPDYFLWRLKEAWEEWAGVRPGAS